MFHRGTLVNTITEMIMKFRIPSAVVSLGVLVFIVRCPLLAADSSAAAIDFSNAVIAVGTDATVPQKHAAQELADHLEQITAQKFKVTNQPALDDRCILVGPQAAQRAEPDFSTAGLGEEGFIIRTHGNNLILAGGEPRGTLYAVYTVLEDHLGCRWWSSTESTIPRKTHLKIAPIDTRTVPQLEYREGLWFDALDVDWSALNKANGCNGRLEAKHGGKHEYAGFVHTFNRLIPPDTYFSDHPEWFSEIDGKRQKDHSQLCLTNDRMRAELVKNLREKLRTAPRATIASVSQNDWHGYCTCSSCAEVDAEEESPAGTMIRFVNKVAAEIEAEFPRVAISTLAYQYTRKPPRLVKPRPNVMVRLCSIECSFSVPLHHQRNQAFRDDIVGWSKICDRLYIWDYTTNFKHHILPHPNLRVLGPNVKFLAAHGAKGIMEQGAYTTNGAEMAELRAWVLAKLLWDPAREGQELIDEFLEGYYGPASQPMRAYLDLMHDEVAQTGDWLGCFAGIAASNVDIGWQGKASTFINWKTLSRAWSYLQAAEQSVANNPQLRFRVQCAQLPVMYAFMMCWENLREKVTSLGAAWPLPESIEQVYNDFVQIARQKKITRLNEWDEGYGNLEKARQKVGRNAG